jgi:hypothetical protein
MWNAKTEFLQLTIEATGTISKSIMGANGNIKFNDRATGSISKSVTGATGITSKSIIGTTGTI